MPERCNPHIHILRHEHVKLKTNKYNQSDIMTTATAFGFATTTRSQHEKDLIACKGGNIIIRNSSETSATTVKVPKKRGKDLPLIMSIARGSAGMYL